jgi:hypothetical protein
VARNAFIRVHDAKVQEYLQPGGEVNDLVHDVAKETRRYARGFIRSRSGELARRIQVNRPRQTGPWLIASLVFTRSHYALSVHEGTANNGAGYIYPTRHKYLTVPVNRRSAQSGSTLKAAWRSGGRYTMNGKPYYSMLRVHGQKANPFLAKGLSAAMADLR